ncbi:hypothetical protein HMPREF1255_0828 [Propionimicrobium sp. BV2F7]|nr:hypothetical protein HMPREF1255_0828 [Propionimicrobium sp. BV2F7]
MVGLVVFCRLWDSGLCVTGNVSSELLRQKRLDYEPNLPR